MSQITFNAKYVYPIVVNFASILVTDHMDFKNIYNVNLVVNNFIKRKKWDETSENICIDCNGNGKTLSSVINRMTKIIGKSGISLDEVKERRFVIPKCDSYNGKYKNMAYLRFNSNLEAKVAYNKLCEVKTGKEKVYFSRPNNLLKIKN